MNALAAVAAASSHQQQAAQQHALLLSAGKDNTLRLWDIGPAVPTNHQQQNGTSKKGASSRSSSGAVQCVAEYRGHTEAVQAVAANPAGSLCCSGGWDGQLLLWRTGVWGVWAGGCWGLQGAGVDFVDGKPVWPSRLEGVGCRGLPLRQVFSRTVLWPAVCGHPTPLFLQLVAKS